MLGEEFAAATKEAGTHARLETQGHFLLRSMRKLAHDSHKARAKGDGIETSQWMKKNFLGFDSEKVGRAEISKRQDWILECLYKLLPLIKPLLKCLASTLALKENVLRKNTLMRLKLLHFDAYIFVCSTMWTVCFAELRALTHSTEADLNPMEVCALCE